MYLRSLEVAGFKSFSRRTKLRFGQGVIAVVGPNGSGKSNIADAVRWTLGEQSIKSLRLKKSEELIFNGTDSKAKASLAEVTLLLDNHDEKMPIDFREVEIRRRIYRSGESDYSLNGHKVRLADIEDILARSGFGQHSYSVIGQGMIDSMIIASPAERKLMFDEASGIRVFEIRRETSLKKLDKAKTSLTRSNDIISELTPRASLLADQAKLLSRRTELESQIEQKRQQYLVSNWHTSSARLQAGQAQEVELKRKLDEVRSKLLELHRQQSDHEKIQAKRSSQVAGWVEDLQKAESMRDKQINSLAVAQAELNVIKESASSSDNKQIVLAIESEQKSYQNQLSIVNQRHTKINQSVVTLEGQMKKFDERIAELTTELNQARSQLNKSQKKEYLTHALGLVQLLRRHQQNPSLTSEEAKLTLHKLARLIRLASEDQSDQLTAQVGKLQNLTTKVLGRREEVAERLTEEVLRLRSLELDISSIELRLDDLDKKHQQLISQVNISDGNQSLIEERSKMVEAEQKKVDDLDKQICQLREKIHAENQAVESSATTDINQAQEAERLGREEASLRAELGRIEVEIKQVDQELTELKKLSQTWFGGKKIFDQLTGDQKLVDLTDIARLEAELEVIGELDPTIIDQAKEANDRLQFITEQKQDLEKAIVDLEKIITGLEGLIGEKFEKAFTKINTKFSDYFTRLFGGGKAMIVLKKDSLGQYGIEIKASPPGKKVELLTSLSGGERALAGMALLAAILSVNPSPFVILDEVDAALDDANSLKFARILHQLSKRSQIIVITHNHETMKIADQLFGITTDKDGDSTLFSVKLEKAKELAEI